MADIVKRLRSHAGRSVGHWEDYASETDSLVQDAADEIERLLAEKSVAAPVQQSDDRETRELASRYMVAVGLSQAKADAIALMLSRTLGFGPAAMPSNSEGLQLIGYLKPRAEWVVEPRFVYADQRTEDWMSSVFTEPVFGPSASVPNNPKPDLAVPALEQQIEAAREFVKRHPALTLIDLAEFEAFLKVPAAMEAALFTQPETDVRAGWIDEEERREHRLATVVAPDNGTPAEVLAAVLECAKAWVPDARIIGNVRAGDIARAIESLSAPETKLTRPSGNHYYGVDDSRWYPNPHPSPSSDFQGIDFRSLAVEIVDRLHGYTYEHAPSPAQHLGDYDDTEAAIRAAVASEGPAE